ncbi:barstar family protein [Allokutzneria sp. A3M-2-11 16]|uniref:barstar family protein n=1 Tax=Allokutzneria sp. A3M-2-11 16 TaxID=2962043 RepID=UPI0020B84F62|nr:barstar family protein [Allokutzneria sp. A3M-2-11 16]MCP3801008.1 barstar family protein [Allokutzneria sp. A3M-2-11 16]
MTTRHVVDGTTVNSKSAAIDAIAKAMSFPSYFGRNLDALYDCLVDLSWLPVGNHVLVWTDHHVLAEEDPDAYGRVRDVLEDAAEANPRLVLRLTAN